MRVAGDTAPHSARCFSWAYGACCAVGAGCTPADERLHHLHSARRGVQRREPAINVIIPSQREEDSCARLPAYAWNSKCGRSHAPKSSPTRLTRQRSVHCVATRLPPIQYPSMHAEARGEKRNQSGARPKGGNQQAKPRDRTPSLAALVSCGRRRSVHYATAHTPGQRE